MSKSPDDPLTVREAYQAMCEFLRGIAQSETAPKEVGRLLSDMVMLADGQPAVDEMWARWQQSVQTVRACEGSVAGYRCRWYPSVSYREKHAGRQSPGTEPNREVPGRGGGPA
jgi:hypothetical protein